MYLTRGETYTRPRAVRRSVGMEMSTCIWPRAVRG